MNRNILTPGYCTVLRALLITNSLPRVVSFAETLPLSHFSSSSNLV